LTKYVECCYNVSDDEDIVKVTLSPTHSLSRPHQRVGGSTLTRDMRMWYKSITIGFHPVEDWAVQSIRSINYE